MALDDYRRKRDFRRTPEPEGAESATPARRFVVHKHQARQLHYDLRLELGGALKSWAIPKGPSLDPACKRLAVHVEDHPLEYADFEGVVPQGQYGAGSAIIWDHGHWEALEGGDHGYDDGMLKFRLFGQKLQGDWMLVRTGRSGETTDNWLLVKERDFAVREAASYDVLTARPESVVSGREIGDFVSRPLLREVITADELLAECAQLAGAVQREPPQSLKPQLAQPSTEVPEGRQWLHEIKLDGYRLIAHKSDDSVRLLTRNGHDWTDRFQSIAAALRELPQERLILDGEVVALLPDGASSFSRLQSLLRDGAAHQLVYFVFDLLYFGTYDVRRAALLERKRILKSLIEGKAARVQFCDHLIGNGSEFLRQCCQRGLEGIVSKRADRPYRSGRSAEWQKCKCVLQDEFVVAGFVPSKSAGFKSLLLGSYNQQRQLCYVGKVGTGFGEADRAHLHDQLGKLSQTSCPFHEPPPPADRRAQWVRPTLVAQIAYAGATGGGYLRHASFLGLREDADATEVIGPIAQEKAMGAEPAETGADSRSARPNDLHQLDELADMTMTHPARVLYPEAGISKLDLAAYYAAVADYILPHVSNRPLTLVRCPDGLAGERFFQKHPFRGISAEIGRAAVAKPGRAPQELLYIRDLRGLVSLAQISALEIHVWGARIDRPDRPDRVVFDLDPDENVSFRRVVATARRLRDILAELSLQSFVKTTGGKGLHVVVPLIRRNTWEQIGEFSLAVAQIVVHEQPGEFTTSMSKAARANKILIDVHRNHFGATSVAPYSTRATATATVAVPLAWEELTAATRPDQYHVGNVPARLRQLSADPWAAMDDCRQSIVASMLRSTRRKS